MLGDLFSRLGRFVWLFEWLGGLDGLGGFGLLVGGIVGLVGLLFVLFLYVFAGFGLFNSLVGWIRSVCWVYLVCPMG